jgi:Uma2 family endonuclease
MPAPVVAKWITAQQLLAMGEGRRELVQGEVLEMTPAGSRHGAVSLRIGARLAQHAEAQGLGVVFAAETGFLLARDPDTVRAPDVAFVRRERAVDTDGYFPGAPDLAVEVVSPHDRYSDLLAKVHDWLTHGAREVWVADPQRRTVVVHRAGGQVVELGADGLVDGGELLPGLALAVRDCFPAPAAAS